MNYRIEFVKNLRVYFYLSFQFCKKKNFLKYNMDHLPKMRM